MNYISRGLSISKAMSCFSQFKIPEGLPLCSPFLRLDIQITDLALRCEFPSDSPNRRSCWSYLARSRVK